MLSGGSWLHLTKGVYNQTWATTTKKENLVNGAYYEPVGMKTTPVTMQGKDRWLAKEVWEWTERELKDWI